VRFTRIESQYPGARREHSASSGAAVDRLHFLTKRIRRRSHTRISSLGRRSGRPFQPELPSIFLFRFHSMNRRFVDHYRCPEEFAHCFLNGEPSEHLGYFRFGPEAICYGSLCKGVVQLSPETQLHDSLKDAKVESGAVSLSFDPDQVIDNLRFERYCGKAQRRSFLSGGLSNKLYYFARPVLGVKVRRHLQKLRLNGWQAIPFPRWPVDRTVEQVHEAMLRLCAQAHDGKVPFIWFWPEGLPGCALITHDVETAKGRDFCPTLMGVDENFGIKSSFQLIPEGRYTLSASIIQEIRSRGFEINIHDLNHDGRLFSSEAKFFHRAPLINQYGRALGAHGFRSGALYRNLAWYGALEFSYDMSVPNAAHLDPQRGGCCTVMPYFIGKILELPVTTTQDYSLFHILNEYSLDHWKRQIGQIMEKHGMASFIVHPDYILEPRLRDKYKSLLAYLADLRAKSKLWIALPGEVNQWWRARSQMKLVRQRNRWVIEGPEKARARVAYAVLDADRLAYEFV